MIVGILASLALSAFFSGMEIAFVSSSRLQAEVDKEKMGISRLPLKVFYDHPNNFVSTMLVGNNIVLVVYGILIATLFDKTIFRGYEAAFTVPADTILSTLIVLFTGEFLPKTFFKSNPNRWLAVFSFPAFLFYIVLWPISRFSTFLSHILLRLGGVRVEREKQGESFSKIDLDYFVQKSLDSVKDEEQIDDEVKIFQNALEFADTKVRDCMVPRTEICAVSDDCSDQELMSAFVDNGRSKIIVYHEDIDHIIGYIHSSDMFSINTIATSSGNHKPQISTLQPQIIREISFVPETMLASRLMKQLMQQKRSLAIVVDEFGGTSGLVSLEDIMEEITGEIEDEHDSTNHVAKQLSDHEFILSARLEISKINEQFDLCLPESDEYMTLGGLILHVYQSFPKLNEVVKFGDFEFKIVKNTATKIELVRLTVAK